MPTITLELPIAGQGVQAGLHAANYADLQALLNGGLDSVNLADDSVGISELSATGTPSATTFLRGDNVWASVGGVDGWTETVALTFSSADAPTYVCTTASSLVGVVGVGDRIKLTHSATVKYFIVTAIDASTITLYGGTDYTLAAGAITLTFYSHHKAPVGLPLSPLKWTVEGIDNVLRTQAAPTQNTWYNIGGNAIAIPIGAWRTQYSVMPLAIDASAMAFDLRATLSTGATTESDPDFTTHVDSGNVLRVGATVHKEKNLVLAAKAMYYLNTSTGTPGVDNLYNRNDISRLILRAECAYL